MEKTFSSVLCYLFFFGGGRLGFLFVWFGLVVWFCVCVWVGGWVGFFLGLFVCLFLNKILPVHTFPFPILVPILAPNGPAEADRAPATMQGRAKICHPAEISPPENVRPPKLLLVSCSRSHELLTFTTEQKWNKKEWLVLCLSGCCLTMEKFY